MVYIPNAQTWMMLGQREPAPRRLTWEELLAEDFQPTRRPDPVNDLSGLDENELRQARQNSLFEGLASIGALLQGDQRRAAAGLGELSGIRERAIGGANQRREEAWQAENQERAGDFARKGQERNAKALYGMYERVSAGESPAFAQRAEQAARAGSMAELQKLDQERGVRARSRQLGVDPDQFTVEELQQQLAMELEKAKRKDELAYKEAEKRRLGTIENELELAQEEQLKKGGYKTYHQDPPQYEPLSRIEEKAKIEAKYRKPDTPDKPRWEVRETSDPITGEKKLVRVNADTGASMPVEPPRAIQQRVADIQSVIGSQLPAAVRAEVERDLAAGRPPREIVAEILRDNPQLRRKK